MVEECEEKNSLAKGDSGLSSPNDHVKGGGLYNWI